MKHCLDVPGCDCGACLGMQVDQEYPEKDKTIEELRVEHATLYDEWFEEEGEVQAASVELEDPVRAWGRIVWDARGEAGNKYKKIEDALGATRNQLAETESKLKRVLVEAEAAAKDRDLYAALIEKLVKQVGDSHTMPSDLLRDILSYQPRVEDMRQSEYHANLASAREKMRKAQKEWENL